MPFNFQDTYVNPNVQIKGEEIPLEQLEKTSNVIQGRYDTSMDNDAKMGAITKKLLASSNPVDHETAKQIMDYNNKRLTERAKSGNYQDIVWQTQQDALDAAGMFEGLSNRNKQIQQGLEKIAVSPDYKSDFSRKEAVRMYNQQLKSAQFNPENNTLENLNVDSFSEAPDIDVANELLKVAPHVRTTTRAGQAAHLGYISAKTGFPTTKPEQGDYLAKIDASGKTEKLSSSELKQEMLKYGKAHTGIQAMIERDLNRAGIQDPIQRKIIGEQMFHQKVDAAANSMSTMFDVNNVGDKGNFQILGAYNDPNFTPLDESSPVRSVRESTNVPAPQNKAISSFIDRFNKNVADYKTDTPKFQDNKENYNILKLFVRGLSIPYLKELQQINPETYKKITTPEMSRTNDGNSNGEKGFNIYGIQNKLNSNKKLNSDELIFVTELMKDQNIQLGSAYKVRNTDDQSYAQEMIENFGENAKNSKGEYDALKADEQLNFKLFGNKNGLELKKVKGLIGGSDQTTISTHAAKGLMTIDPISGKIKPLSDYLKEDLKDLNIPDGTIIKTSGKVEPGSIMTANSSNPYNSNRNIAKAAGNAYTLDVGGNEIIVFNPLDAETTNATKSELSKFSYGVYPKEKVTLHLNGRQPTEMEFQSDGRTVDLFFKNGQQITMNNEQFKNWINKIK
jgi:hypothetical protein